MTAAPKRRRYQFSLKAMLLVTTLACLAFAWLAYERNEVRKREAAIAAIEGLRGRVYFDETKQFRPVWLRLLLGGNSPGEVAIVDLPNTKITDADLAHVTGLSELKVLFLYNTQVSDAGLVHLDGLSNLRSLWLYNTQVTDAGLVHIAGHTKLDELHLENNRVTDAGITHLQGLTKLEKLYLSGTLVTDQGVSQLQKAISNVEIYR